jgi:deoxyribonuclease-4
VIRLGPSGVPLSCKGRTLKDGVEFTHELGLGAMAVQVSRGIRIEEEYAEEVGDRADELGVQLSVHSPYYTNLGSDDEEVVQNSIDKIVMSGHMGDVMGANVVVAHPGFYTSLDPQETKEKITQNASLTRDFFRDSNYQVDLGLEVMGKKQTFGTLDEVIELCEEIGEGVVPVIDFAHIHARSNGGLREREDFEEIFEKLDSLGLDRYYTYFTGVEYENGNEVSHKPIKKADLDFDILGQMLLEEGYDVTVISISPLVEHDAIYMKIRLERMLDDLEREGTFKEVAQQVTGA